MIATLVHWLRSLKRMIQPLSISFWRRAYEQEKMERLRIADAKWQYKCRAEDADIEIEQLREALEKIADPQKAPSSGDPAVLREIAKAALNKLKHEKALNELAAQAQELDMGY